LNQLRLKLKGWNANLKRVIKDKKVQLTSSIKDFELLLETRDLSSDEYDAFFGVKNELHNVYRDEMIYWQQRARLQWLHQGDTNTRFFHSIASSRKRTNLISSLHINGTETRDSEVIKAHILGYYKNLLGSKGSTWVSFSNTIWEQHECVLDSENASLIAPFTEEEIRCAVFSMNPNKSPGPDGFSILFYQKFWALIKHDIVHLFSEFYNHSLDIAKLNRALICLIPKVVDTVTIKDFRPISLLNYSFRIFTKVLTSRLHPVLDRLIGFNQHAFLKGRNIMDNVIVAHEILHSVKSSKEPSLLLKLDFEKAFDNVDWNYILNSFKQRGFDPKWVRWMESILWGGHSAVLLNGVPGTYFECRKGVRQGDPLSPYLFLLAAEGLNKILTKGIDLGHLEGLGPPILNGHKILHLQYADDTLLFLKADYLMIERVKWALRAFEGLLGLKINFNKSELIGLNVDLATTNNFALQLHCKLGSLPLKYLGLALHWKKPSRQDWQRLVDKINNKLPTWKGKLLSLGGRLVLLNSVISAIPLYYIILFKIPCWVLIKIDRIRKRFLWAGSDITSRKYHLIRWKVICRPKEFGGWGVLNLEFMNISFLCK
jgi:Reverse transcriptase (RNA-dependent DNA polymerase)